MSAEEAEQFCASLNEHFAEQKLEFLASHSQRWWLRFALMPNIEPYC